jgi:2-methylcitrate dehydratase PrpD
MSVAGATEQLAAFALAPTTKPTPALQDLLTLCMLDFVGLTAYASRFAESSDSFRGFLSLGFDGGDTTVIGDARRYHPPHAALLNGAFAHTLDFDDTNFASSLHPGAPVIAAILAHAEQQDVSGSDFIEALTVGYEICCRIGRALTPAAYERGFHITPVAGIFGGVAGAARLADVSPAVLSSAFGLAGSRAAGSMQYLANGSWNKRLHPGFAAHDALMVLSLAQAGTLGAVEALEGRYGLLHSHTDKAAPDTLTAGLGEEWVTLGTALKPYPSCRLTHSAIDAILLLRDRVTSPIGETRITVRLAPTAYKIVGIPDANKLAPANIVDGQFSAYFQVASALADGRVDWASYDRIGDAAFNRTLEQIQVKEDPDVVPSGAVVEIESDGETLRERVDEPLGEPSNPLDWESAGVKFLSLASPVWGEAKAAEIMAAIRELPDAKSMAAFARSLAA